MQLKKTFQTFRKDFSKEIPSHIGEHIETGGVEHQASEHVAPIGPGILVSLAQESGVCDFNYCKVLSTKS